MVEASSNRTHRRLPTRHVHSPAPATWDQLWPGAPARPSSASRSRQSRWRNGPPTNRGGKTRRAISKAPEQKVCRGLAEKVRSNPARLRRSTTPCTGIGRTSRRHANSRPRNGTRSHRRRRAGLGRKRSCAGLCETKGTGACRWTRRRPPRSKTGCIAAVCRRGCTGAPGCTRWGARRGTCASSATAGHRLPASSTSRSDNRGQDLLDSRPNKVGWCPSPRKCRPRRTSTCRIGTRYASPPGRTSGRPKE
mmetsp:Transcript_120495/g.340906  ORF Transcript_120495/g.340906 Transcript_120495/m.340906 type:complete len:250 (-) Transcript_120495:463-1212(-)